MSHVAHMSETRHKYEWVTSNIRVSHATYMNESFTHMSQSCHTYEKVMPHLLQGEILYHSAATCIIYALDTNIQVRDFIHSQLSLICMPWLIHNGPMTHSCVIYAIDTNIQVRKFPDSKLSLTYVSWLIHKGHMTHACIIDAFDTKIQLHHIFVWVCDSVICDSFTTGSRLIHTCDITHLYVIYALMLNCMHLQFGMKT